MRLSEAERSGLLIEGVASAGSCATCVRSPTRGADPQRGGLASQMTEPLLTTAGAGHQLPTDPADAERGTASVPINRLRRNRVGSPGRRTLTGHARR